MDLKVHLLYLMNFRLVRGDSDRRNGGINKYHIYQSLLPFQSVSSGENFQWIR